MLEEDIQILIDQTNIERSLAIANPHSPAPNTLNIVIYCFVFFVSSCWYKALKSIGAINIGGNPAF